MDIMSGYAIVKEAAGLIKVIKEARDEQVIRQAAGDLSAKITDLQLLNAEVSGLLQAERQITMELKAEKAKIEMFTVKSVNYDLYTTEGGATVYRSKKGPDMPVTYHYLCAHCYDNYKISILQPRVDHLRSHGFFVHYCPECKNEFMMNKAPPQHRPQVSRIF